MNLFKKLFCKHKNSEVICWHWTRGFGGLRDIFLEVQLKCNDCGKYYFIEITDKDKCDNFVSKYKDKEWSDICRPVL